MVYKRGYRRVTAGTQRKYVAKSRRKRAATTTLAKYQKPTARNQRTQIMRNARDIKRLYASVLTNRVFCDWQYVGQVNATFDAAGYTTTWGCFPLTRFASWNSVLRKDANVLESSTTFVRNMNINMRYALKRSSYAQFNVWIVTNRKYAASRDWPSEISGGADPIQGTDYIEGPEAFALRLNSNLFKVHFASYKTLTETTLFEEAPSPPLTAGNPSTTWSKGTANIKCNMKVRNPTSTDPWTEHSYMQQPYYKRYFLLVAVVALTPSDGFNAQFDFDMLATTINDT